MSRQTLKPIRLAVLISGGGRTLENILHLAAEGTLPVDVRLVISSNRRAGGLQYAHEARIPSAVFERKQFASDEAFGTAVFNSCREAEVDYVAMAGFLKLAPVPEDFAGRVLNIHPSLIPSFCGHGMYGHHVHEAVLDYGAKVTGCTVHFVDNEYDRGPIIWQQPVPVFDDDTADTLAARVFEAEKESYPHVLKLLAAGKIHVDGRRVTIVGR
ncbi:phosphoribosylglycinamide formyltransferase [Bythopirellula polymerisocia]|uniref:Phosphoribosylglycinamide formyltransferase n=1 Tax=Bythopirellula polymerisocia TaxID=2528003 RepID=A0A5C6CPX7_9BACT|nr:phosphoribosylglycinamide formyltransferase [Bythopirellula polymerisocia]TWU26095.1 Phosphoribosylglycinamide formyltransferase [Bythopirellula polymerisocia]